MKGPGNWFTTGSPGLRSRKAKSSAKMSAVPMSGREIGGDQALEVVIGPGELCGELRGIGIVAPAQQVLEIEVMVRVPDHEGGVLGGDDPVEAAQVEGEEAVVRLQQFGDRALLHRNLEELAGVGGLFVEIALHPPPELFGAADDEGGGAGGDDGDFHAVLVT